MDWTGIAGLITALGLAPVLLVITQHWIKNSERRAEERAKRIKEKADEDRAALIGIYSKLWAYMWKLLFTIDADRVYIIQPHPIHERQFISISLETVHPERDVASHKDGFQFRRLSEWSWFASALGTKDWVIFRSLDDIKAKDLKTYSEAYRRGVQSVYFRRLCDVKRQWIGTLCVEYTHKNPSEYDFIKGNMIEKATLIADILPEYKPKEG